MGGRVFESLRVPADFWSRWDVREALGGRDFGTLCRLLGKYAGASQTKIAIAVGMTQGQISRFMNGTRQLAAIDVAERAFDGLDAPDDARIAFGLAPRSPVGRSQADWVLPRPGPSDTEDGVRCEPATDDDVHRRDVLRLGGAAAFGALTSPQDGARRLAQVANALTSYGALSGDTPAGSGAPTVSELAAAVARAKHDYQSCRYCAVLDALPGLLDAVRLGCSTACGDELLRVYGLAADAYQVTGSVMLKFDDLGLAALAADRSMDAAMRTEDLVTLAASARLVTHSLIRGGYAARARDVASRAAERLGGGLHRPSADALSVYGALLLRGAIAAATDEDRAGAATLLDEADEAARRLGRDDNAHWTAFGPTNVTLHRVNAALVLGDAGTAVDLARRVDLRQIPIAERKATLFVDTAQAFSQWGKHERAYHALRAAEEVAPEEVRTLRSVRRLVGELATRAPRTVRLKVREFADQIGVEV